MNVALPRDMLRRGVMAQRAAHHAQPQFLGAAVKLQPTSAASLKPTMRVWRVEAPPISVSALRSSARADVEAILRARAQIVDRREVFGQRRDRLIPVVAAGRDMFSISAFSAARARFGIAAMPPKAMRAPAMRVPSRRSLNAPITAEMSESKRLEIL